MITNIVKEIEDIITDIRYSHVERVNKTIDKIKQYKGQMRPDIRLKLASDEHNSAKNDFVCAVNKWFEKNYKPKEGEDDVMFSDAYLRPDGDISISYSYCNFEIMDLYYDRLTDDDGHYYGSIVVKPEEIFK